MGLALIGIAITGSKRWQIRLKRAARRRLHRGLVFRLLLDNGATFCAGDGKRLAGRKINFQPRNRASAGFQRRRGAFVVF